MIQLWLEVVWDHQQESNLCTCVEGESEWTFQQPAQPHLCYILIQTKQKEEEEEGKNELIEIPMIT